MSAIPYAATPVPIPVGEARPVMPFEAAPYFPALEIPDQLRRSAYVSALARFDWSHEFSDDASVARAGRRRLEELRHEQEQIDPDFAIWNKHCHPACKNGARYA